MNTDTRQAETVIITGASAGVGRAVAHEFARHGAAIGLISRNTERLQDVKQEVEKLGGQALIITGDVADPEVHEKAAEKIEQTFGKIDIWINNAMASVFSEFINLKPDEFKRVTEVTYLGQVYGTMAALKRMQPRNRGTIVQVGSALAYRAIPLQSAYCGAKHGIRGFTDSVRTELMHHKSNVHLTMVQLPALNTPQFEWVRSKLPNQPQPVPPIFQPEVAAQGIHWAAHHKRRELYIGANTSLIIALNKLMPWAGDKYLSKKGFASQMTDQPADPNRPDNLYTTIPGAEYTAHGRFSHRSKSSSRQLWLTTHRPLVGLALTAVILGFLTVMFRKK